MGCQNKAREDVEVGLLVISTLVLPKEEGPRMLHLSDPRLPARLSPNTCRKKGKKGGGEKEPEFSGKGTVSRLPLSTMQLLRSHCGPFPSPWGTLAHESRSSTGWICHSLGYSARPPPPSPSQNLLRALSPGLSPWLDWKQDKQSLPGPSPLAIPRSSRWSRTLCLHDNPRKDHQGGRGTYLHTWVGGGPSSDWCHVDM